MQIQRAYERLQAGVAGVQGPQVRGRGKGRAGRKGGTLHGGKGGSSTGHPWASYLNLGLGEVQAGGGPLLQLATAISSGTTLP